MQQPNLDILQYKMPHSIQIFVMHFVKNSNAYAAFTRQPGKKVFKSVFS